MTKLTPSTTRRGWSTTIIQEMHTKFGVPMENEMPITIIRSVSKPEVEFQNGGRSFSQTGSSFNSAVDWDIFTKFGTLRDPNLLRTCALPNWNREWFATSTAAILKMLMTSYIRRRWSDLHEIWYADAEWDADDDWWVKIETGSRISIWRPLVFRNQK